MSKGRRFPVALVLCLGLFGSACGSDASLSSPTAFGSGECVVTQLSNVDASPPIDPDDLQVEDAVMVVSVNMSEYSYDCNMPTIPAGVVVAFQFTNDGQLPHEAAIGSVEDQIEAEQATVDLREPEHDHPVPSIIVQPGSIGQLLVYFDEPTDVEIGCHISGHWNQGMRADLSVGTT